MSSIENRGFAAVQQRRDSNFFMYCYFGGQRQIITVDYSDFCFPKCERSIFEILEFIINIPFKICNAIYIIKEDNVLNMVILHIDVGMYNVHDIIYQIISQGKQLHKTHFGNEQLERNIFTRCSYHTFKSTSRGISILKSNE